MNESKYARINQQAAMTTNGNLLREKEFRRISAECGVHVGFGGGHSEQS